MVLSVGPQKLPTGGMPVKAGLRGQGELLTKMDFVDLLAIYSVLMCEMKQYGIKMLIVVSVIAIATGCDGLIGAAGGDTVDPVQVEAPVISPSGGTYSGSVQVSIESATSGAAIRYTTDGSIPSPTTGTSYNGTFVVSEWCKISAIAFKDGMDDSPVVQAEFFIESQSLTWTEIVPSANGADVMLSTDVTMVADGSLDPTTVSSSTVSLLESGASSPVSGTVSYDDATTTITFTPASNLSPNATYTLTATGLTGAGGEAVAEWSSEFTTGRVIRTFSIGYGGFYRTSPTVAGDHIYIGTSTASDWTRAANHYFVKLTKDFDVVWQKDYGQREIVSAASLDAYGNIYFYTWDRGDDTTTSGTYFNKLASDGTEVWSLRVSTAHHHAYFAPTVSPDGSNVYAPRYRADATSTTPPSLIDTSPQSGATYIADTSGNLYLQSSYKLDSALSALVSNTTYDAALPTFNADMDLPALALNADESRLFVAGTWSDGDDTNGYDLVGILCLEVGTMTEAWRYGVPDHIGSDQVYIRTGAAVDASGAVYFGTKTMSNQNSRIVSINADGSEKWNRSDWGTDGNGSDVYNVPAVGNDGTLYLASENTGLYAINPADGSTLWTQHLRGGDATHSSVALTGEGVALIGTMGGSADQPGVLHAIAVDATGYQTGAGWPRFGGGNQSANGAFSPYTP